MNLKKLMLISLIIIGIYIIFSLNMCVYAGQYVSAEEAEKLAPGITNMINNLKNMHPNYNFQFFNTGIDWNEAIVREYQGHNYSPKNLFNVGDKYSGMWHCPVCGDKRYDNGTLCCASMDVLKYMMDPRNSISDASIFQFKSLEAPDVSYEDVVRVISGTFLDHEECARAVVEASQAYNINGYYLVAKMLTEHGTKGSTLSNGVIKNGVTYYNFFNIGAYGNSVQDIITNGTNYAAGAGWSTKRASILGGAEIVRNSYVGRGQNTCYYQKYNVVHEASLFSHQYAQNVLSAENEGRKLRRNYTINGQIVGNHTFIIPLYTGMPANATARPSVATVNSITYDIAKVIANGGLKVRAREDINSMQIGAVLQNDQVKVIRRGNVISGGYYWDLIISNSNGLCGYVARNYLQNIGQGSNSGSASPNEYIEEPVGPPPGSELSFYDVYPNKWYYEPIKYCSKNRIITGTSKTTFEPDANLTRGMVVTILYRLAGEPTIETDSMFLDVQDSNKYYYNAVKWASSINVVHGYSNGNFGPNDNIKRQDLAVILSNYASYLENDISSMDTDLSIFADSDKISEYAINAVKWAVNAKLLHGNDKDKTLNPQGSATRAEAAAIFERYCKNFSNN